MGKLANLASRGHEVIQVADVITGIDSLSSSFLDPAYASASIAWTSYKLQVTNRNLGGYPLSSPPAVGCTC